MLRLSKKVEYALLALQYMSSRTARVCTVKEIAENFNISFELLAKVMSVLSKKGIVQSLQGINGGFSLTKESSSISIADVIAAVENKKSSIVECESGGDHANCYVEERCTIRHPLQRLQTMIDNAFESMTVLDLHKTEPSFVHVELN